MARFADRVLADEEAIVPLLERERSRMTHQLFLLAESGALPTEAERRTAARSATVRAWMVHVAGQLPGVWSAAPGDLGERVDRWFAVNGERRESIELTLADRIAAGPVGDLPTRERRLEYGGAARWLAAAIGDIVDPDGDGGAGFASRVAGALDAGEDAAASRAAELRLADPDDVRIAERAELVAQVEAVADALERTIAGD